jgi:hypothetical protein
VHSLAILEAIGGYAVAPPVIALTSLEESEVTPIASRHGAVAIHLMRFVGPSALGEQARRTRTGPALVSVGFPDYARRPCSKNVPCHSRKQDQCNRCQ